jgi:hypothetical protein
MACGLLARQMAGDEVGVKALNLLRMMLNSMGATPSDASKISMPEDDAPDDPANKYF